MNNEHRFAELLSLDIDRDDITREMGWANRKTYNAMLQRLRKKLGVQAV